MKVRISSDAAGAISLTPVIVREMTLAELMDYVVGVCGKEGLRIHDVLARGTLVSGASRFRWEGFEVTPAQLTAELSRFPEPDPSRPFTPERCALAILRGGSHQLPVARDAASKRRLFRRSSLWEHLLALGASAAYVGYSYREKADHYRAHVSAAAQSNLREATQLLAYSTLARQLDAIAIESVDLYVPR